MSLTGSAARWIAVAHVLVFLATQRALSLENGLARTPPMGWLSWERFRCNVDCVNDEKNCIREELYMEMADLMASQGYREAGYEYVIVDDCWMSKSRDSNGRLQPDPKRFPSGMKALANYVQSKGLKFGIYEDYGNFTCGGYPGVLGHLETDAQTFGDWDVDYVKLDGCYALPKDMDQGYPEFGKNLNKTGRPMIYSCSWPVYQIISGIAPNYTSIINSCNLWRNYDDIDDSWNSVTSILEYYGDNQDVMIPNAGPGHWNDPDMLIIGNFGLSYEQSRAQMALWAILASPLIMSVDLRTIRNDYKEILQNKRLIAVNQDPLGIQGRRVFKGEDRTRQSGIEIWAKPIQPVQAKYYSYAIAFLNHRVDGSPTKVSIVLEKLGLKYDKGYKITELFDNTDLGVLTPDDTISVSVNPSGVVIVRADIVASGYNSHKLEYGRLTRNQV